jgi:two-component system sensor histidine kinase CpxA
MRWRNSLFIKIFLWFWIVVVISMTVATLSFQWLQDDYHRPLELREQILLQRIAENVQPLTIKKRGLWARLEPGWNVVKFEESQLNDLPHDVAEFYEHAVAEQQSLWGQEDGFMMMGPLVHHDQIYIAVSRYHWRHSLDEGERWLIPFLVVVMVSFLCGLLAWHLTSPIRRLQKAAKKLSAGDFDISELRSNLNRGDELGDLSIEFVEMADSLQRLLQSHRQLLRDVSHELRSPLTRLQIALGIARKKDADNTLQAEHDRIERAAGQVANLVTQILDLAKLQQEGDLTTERLDLVRLFKTWLQDAELELAAKHLTVEWQLETEEVFFNIDAVLMQRAFDNVLRNAIRFSPDSGVLTLSLGKVNQRLIFKMSDQGPGVSEDQLEDIFSPFTQADPSRSHAASGYGGGYGIGLAMVQRILNMHHGDVRAKNIQGSGLCVEWSLPDRSKP